MAQKTKKPTIKKSITKKTSAIGGSAYGGKKGEEKSAPISQSNAPKEQKPPEPNQEEKFYSHYKNYYQAGDSAKRLMILAVAGFTIVIVALWGFAMRYRIGNVNWEEANKKGIVGNAQNTWNEIFTETQQETQKKEDLKKQIAQLLAEMALTSTSTITNTITTNTTSPNNLSTTTITTTAR